MQPERQKETDKQTFAHAPTQIAFLPRDSKGDNDHVVEQATKLVDAGVVGIVGSPQSGTTATVQNLLQRSTSIAQLGEWHWVVTVDLCFNCLFG